MHMSPLGQSGHVQCNGMSALCQSRHLAPQQNNPLFDHRIGAGQERSRNFDAQRLGRLHVDDEFEFGRQLDRHIGRLLTFENAADINAAWRNRSVKLDP